jgi:hypothetical protein
VRRLLGTLTGKLGLKLTDAGLERCSLGSEFRDTVIVTECLAVGLWFRDMLTVTECLSGFGAATTLPLGVSHRMLA